MHANDVIVNWNIDSDLLYEIAIVNDYFREYVETNPTSEWDSSICMAPWGNTIWGMWGESGHNEIYVQIDADTGHIIDVI